jgi:tetratricopeptide (TPR) repeat protein
MSTRPLAGEATLRQAAAWALLAAAGVALAAVLWWGLRGRGAFIRPQAGLPDAPGIEAAVAAAQQRLKEDPQDLRALVELGTLHFKKGKDSYPDAVNFLEEARALGALDTRIFYCLGVMYQELGLYPFALIEYRRFLRNHPQDKEIRLLTAKLLYRQGSFLEAAGEYERLRFHHPGDRLIEENLGLSLWRAKNVERAVEVFSQLRAAGGATAQRAEFYLGQISFEKGETAAALTSLLKSLPAEGQKEEVGLPPAEVQAALGAAYQKLGMGPEAKEAWQRVLKLAPGDAKATAALKELNRRFPVKKSAKK